MSLSCEKEPMCGYCKTMHGSDELNMVNLSSFDDKKKKKMFDMHNHIHEITKWLFDNMDCCLERDVALINIDMIETMCNDAMIKGRILG